MKYLIWANFKMNKTSKEVKEYLEVFKDRYSCFLNIDLMIAPWMATLEVASDILKWSCVKLGSQNMHYELAWAYTWEVSACMLNDLNCEYVILGHSERRQYFNETDELINKKVKSAIKNSIRPILCIGETLDQKENNLTKEILKIQIINWLKDIKDFSEVDIAYEPVWAIWTWKIPTLKEIEDVHAFIRSVVWDNDSTRIIYGWSVKPENSNEIIKIDNVNWFLVWWASLKADEFLKIAEIN